MLVASPMSAASQHRKRIEHIEYIEYVKQKRKHETNCCLLLFDCCQRDAVNCESVVREDGHQMSSRQPRWTGSLLMQREDEERMKREANVLGDPVTLIDFSVFCFPFF